MGKRSNFERNPRDYYKTPYEAVLPLLPHLPESTSFVEPCAGDGALVTHLAQHGHYCADAYDIEPQAQGIRGTNALATKYCAGDMFITNPPWARVLLHPLILILSAIKPTWLLFDADWKHTVRAIPYLRRCRRIVSVGRVKWIEGTDNTGKDNAAWYLFTGDVSPQAEFYGRTR